MAQVGRHAKRTWRYGRRHRDCWFGRGSGGDATVDANGRYLLPGFIDAHSHADAAVFSPDVQLGLLRQGVTTIIVGQDGVSYAPGNGDYATEYFGALIGRHPGYCGGGVGELLAQYDATTPINVGYLIPAVRFVTRSRDMRLGHRATLKLP